MSETENGQATPEPEAFTFPERYLGDGVYASYDGYQVWLDTRAQTPVHRIAVDAHVFRGLVAYVGEIEDMAQKRAAEPNAAAQAPN